VTSPRSGLRGRPPPPPPGAGHAAGRRPRAAAFRPAPAEPASRPSRSVHRRAWV